MTILNIYIGANFFLWWAIHWLFSFRIKLLSSPGLQRPCMSLLQTTPSTSFPFTPTDSLAFAWGPLHLLPLVPGKPSCTYITSGPFVLFSDQKVFLQRSHPCPWDLKYQPSCNLFISSPCLVSLRSMTHICYLLLCTFILSFFPSSMWAPGDRVLCLAPLSSPRYLQ